MADGKTRGNADYLSPHGRRLFIKCHALEDGVVDKVIFFIAPVIIGGRESFPAVGGKTFRRLEDAYRIKNVRIKRIGEDLLIEGYLR
jgi:diaminohydroxyphosphoribosylaminopyrimidine deaminase/5-amino-6-(5-phosphoribosylamino)uracil reductase